MAADRTKFVGLFPAGGLAKRLGISSSKEVLPVLNEAGNYQPVGQFLLDSFSAADIKTVYIILREEKQDILTVFGNGEALDLNINYLNLKRFWGTPYTLDEAWPLVKNHNIALGFPDIILKPRNCFQAIKAQLLNSTADIVLGLFPTERPQKSDMVELDEHGLVKKLHIKPQHTSLTHTWVIAVWRPRFTRFMHDYLTMHQRAFEDEPNRKEPFVGSVINAALKSKFVVHGIPIPQGQILDIGTPDDLNLATTSGFFAINNDQ